MAPSSSASGARRGDNSAGSRPDRKIRKPLVERKRRARINESLQELRVLISDGDTQSKMENAEVLELTVRKVESILQNRAQDGDVLNREAHERFAAGYIQCVHDVHTFVSSCPGTDAVVAAELLNHLLENMPLSEEDCLRLTPLDTMVFSVTSGSPSDDLCSDLDETDSEQSHLASCEDPDNLEVVPCLKAKSLWRPW
ncbi:transcription cofactor HES-6 [Pholidichthys leucotaenia]